MIKFSKDKVLLLHRLIAEETGGSIGVRDEALLDSALENAFAGFGEQEFYPTKEEKGARLGYAAIRIAVTKLLFLFIRGLLTAAGRRRTVFLRRQFPGMGIQRIGVITCCSCACG